MKSFDLDKAFDEFYDGAEGFRLRSERAVAELESNPSAGNIRTWMHAAFIAGAKTMAYNTVDTLQQYAASSPGRLSRYSQTDALDMAAEKLAEHYQELFYGG